jgi:hypothetical protein
MKFSKPLYCISPKYVIIVSHLFVSSNAQFFFSFSVFILMIILAFQPFKIAYNARAQRPGPGFCYPWQAHINLHFFLVPFSMILNTRLPRGAILSAGLAFVRSLAAGNFLKVEFFYNSCHRPCLFPKSCPSMLYPQ